MPKCIKPADADNERMVSKKFRTTPIKSTIKRITGLPRSAILYKCAASSYWQFRVHLEGKPRKRSTKQEEIAKAEREAKKIYSEMLAQVTSGEISVQPTTRNTLQQVAKSLWAKNETRIKNKELNEEKVAKDTYVFERHIKPFFNRYDIKDIDLNLLERFKGYLADNGLSPATQVSYINLVLSLLKEAQVKRLITHVPPKPRVRTDDGVRGFFDDNELVKLKETIRNSVNYTFDFKDQKGVIYRKTRITEELGVLVDFMVATYIRPTDVKVIRHRDIRLVEKEGITFLVLEHEKTKLHKKNMVSTEQGVRAYSDVIAYQTISRKIKLSDFLFQPNASNRDSALKNLSTQFSAILIKADMETDRHGKPRTLYSLRHTAIVRSLRKGIPIELVASNARTSTEMIRRFYGVHIDNILETGSIYVDKEKERRANRKDKQKVVMGEILGRDIGGRISSNFNEHESRAVKELLVERKRMEQAENDGISHTDGAQKERSSKSVKS